MNVDDAIAWNTRGAPLGDGRKRDAEPFGHAGGTPPFLIEPFTELHPASLGHAKRPRQVPPKPQMFSICCMSGAERKRAVREYFRVDLKGDRAEFQKRTGYTKGRVTQILTGEEPLGEKAAIEIARRLRLPDDYFLGNRAIPTADTTARHAELLQLWDGLFADQREHLLMEIRAEYQRTRKAMSELRARGLLKEDVPENVLPPEFTRPAQRALEIVPTAPPSRRQKK